MPTYQYECDACNHSFELLQSMLGPKLKKCPECGKDSLHRLIGSGSGIIFKGSGFYETDYKKKTPPKGDESQGGSKTKEKPPEPVKGSEASSKEGSGTDQPEKGS